MHRSRSLGARLRQSEQNSLHPTYLSPNEVIPNSALSPSDNPPGWRHPTEQGCDTENVEIKTTDGITLRGWLLKNDKT